MYGLTDNELEKLCNLFRKHEEIEQAVKNAEQFAEEDKKRREEVETKNEAENLCYAVEKLINENGDKIDSTDKDNLNAKIKSLKDAISANNMDTIKSGKEDLQKAMYEVSAKLYQNAAPNQTADAAENQNNNTNTTQNGENVYEADFKDVDNNK